MRRADIEVQSWTVAQLREYILQLDVDNDEIKRISKGLSSEMIAMALVAKSKIIIADEPTTALDADVAGVILDLFEKINSKYGTSIILISHDLRVIGRVSDRTIIMQNGEIVERLSINKDRREIYSMMVTDEKKNGDKSGKVSGTNGYSRPLRVRKMMLVV